MVLSINKNELTQTSSISNKSGRTIAIVKDNKVVISQRDFRRVANQIRSLLNQTSLHFIIQ